MSCKTLSIVLLCIFASTLFVMGQSQPPYRKFRILGWFVNSGSTPIYYTEEDKDVPVTFQPDVRSVFYKYLGPDIFDLYKISMDSNGKPIHTPVAHIDITSAGKWPLLILSSDPSQSALYRAVAIPDDLTALPAGAIEMINFTSQTSMVKVSSESYEVQPNDIKLAQPHPTGTNATLFVQLLQGAHLLYGNNWAYWPTMRTILFVAPSKQLPSGVAAKRLVETAIFPPDKDDPTTPQ